MERTPGGDIPESGAEFSADNSASEAVAHGTPHEDVIAPRATRLHPPQPLAPHATSVGARRRGIALILLVSVLAILAVGAASAYLQYSQVRATAADGLLHLKRLQSLLAPELRHPTIPDPTTLATVEHELTAAEHDFSLTRRDLGRGVFPVAAGASAAGNTLAAVAALAAAADEACLAGLDLAGVGDILLPLLRADLFTTGAPSTTPTLTAAMMRRVTADFEDATRRLAVTFTYAHSVNLAALPASVITAQQVTQVNTLLAQWPRYTSQLATVDAWLHVAPALLGLNGPTRLLVELMDRGETRATGGYIGNYGVLTIQNGTLAPFSLIDVYTLDIPYAVEHGWPNAPAPYTWWPFHGFGLRDSNLSPSFPTSAQMGIHQLAKEGGPAVQGVVALNALVIARALAVVGPVTVPGYSQMVTSENLEAMIRLYTETPQVRLTARHQRFTIALGRAFMSKLHGLSSGQMLAIAQTMFTSLRAKDLQVYLSDPAAETLLAQQGLDGALIQGPSDILTIVDDNVSGNKSNLFTTLAAADAVTLDAQGTATHHLTITHHFDSATNPTMRPYLYGRRVYRTYLRIYTPPSATLTSLDGFAGRFQQINKSDEPNHQMWGGYVYVRDGVPYELHFEWSVPHVATQDASGQWRYDLAIQRQAGTQRQLALAVTAPGATQGELQSLIGYMGVLDHDRTFRTRA
jgi:Protein of unknown function (DUF4012)